MAAYTAVDDSEAHFQVKTWTGDGEASLALTLPGDTNMQPDLVWIKARDATEQHPVFDAIRTATNYMLTNGTNANYAEADTLLSFNSDGFTVGADDKVNADTKLYVAWNWKAGTTSGIAGSPSITPSSYSFNATSGFSIIAYTGNSTAGATLPHGLGVAPKMIFGKKVNGTDGWGVFHASMDATAPEDYNLFLNTTAARADSPMWNDTPPTSTLFSLGSGGDINSSSNTYIAYCFAEKQGFSKFGSYEGSGNADGQFVFTGFRPAWIMTKSVDSTSAWHIFDNKREGYNVDNDPLVADATTVEATTDMIDIVSQGFKFRISTDPNVAETYIYAAFAEAPLVNSEGVPNNAR